AAICSLVLTTLALKVAKPLASRVASVRQFATRTSNTLDSSTLALCSKGVPRAVSTNFCTSVRHLVALGIKHGAACEHRLDGIHQLGALRLKIRDILGGFLVVGLALFILGASDRLIEQLADSAKTFLGFRDGGLVLVEGIAQDGPTDRLQLCHDF